MVIGVVGGWRLQRLGPSMLGSFSYSITFFMYAAMITSGLFVHCLFLVECGAAPTTEVTSYTSHMYSDVTQWNLSKPDTLGTEESISIIARCPDIRGCNAHKWGIWDGKICSVYQGVLISGCPD